MIHKVKEFRLGDWVGFDGEKCFIKSFPTRTTIVLVPINPLAAGWYSQKTSISKLRKEGTDIWGRPLKDRS